MMVPARTETCRSKYYNFKIVLTFPYFYGSVHQLEKQECFLILLMHRANMEKRLKKHQHSKYLIFAHRLASLLSLIQFAE
jgi:hypothetical protein